MQGAWSGAVIAELEDTAVIEGNHCFGADAMKLESFEPTSTSTVEDAAWVWPEITHAVENVEGRVAFRRGVAVGESGAEDVFVRL